MGTPNDTDWLIGHIHDGNVGLDPNWRYCVTVSATRPPVDCDDQVYALDDAGLITLTDARVKLSAAGRRHPAAVAKAANELSSQRRRAARAVQFQASAA